MSTVDWMSMLGRGSGQGIFGARSLRAEEFEERMGRWVEVVLNPAEQSFQEAFPWRG